MKFWLLNTLSVQEKYNIKVCATLNPTLITTDSYFVLMPSQLYRSYQGETFYLNIKPLSKIENN